MLIKNVTRSELYEALSATSEQFDGNVTYNRFDFAGHTRREWLEKYNVTLRVKDSHAPGHRLSFEHTTRNGNSTQHTMVAACWHVHRAFLDALATLQPNVEVVSVFGTWRPGDMHHDPMVGSQMYPQYASELCECGT